MKNKAWIKIIVIAGAVLFGFIIGNILANKNLQNDGSNKFSLNGIFKNGGNTGKINQMLNIINSDYVDTISIKNLTEELAGDLASTLDPHSVYISANDLQEVNSDLEGTFSGIGVQFNIQNDTVMIVSVISGGPSEKVGLLAGDRIVKVDGKDFTGKTITNERVLKTLRGAKGSKVTLTIYRNGTQDNLDYTVTRGDIPVNSVVAAYIIAPQTGFIRVDKFAQNTYAEFLNALAQLHQQGARKFIIDLRENSGGLMEQAIEMVNEFLPRGQMIVYSKGKNYPYFEAKSDGKGSCINNPIVVLIDDFSASASEIFSGAIQDNDRGLIIGRRSFGKGLVQQQFPLDDGSAFRMTVARYYTPSGRSIQKPYTRGKTADYEMDLVHRYENGEFDSKDKVKVADSLVYKTIGGRKVYGGGGIMPDIFVPRDTTEYSPFFNKTANSGYLIQFAFYYTDKNRETLNKFKSWKELQKYLDNQSLVNQFVTFSEGKGVKAAEKDVKTSNRLINNLLEAYIIRNIIGNEGFYPVFYQDDNVVKTAIRELQKK